MVLPSTAGATFLLVTSLAQVTALSASPRQADPELGAAMRALRSARDVCDWEGTIARARIARSLAPRGSDDWFEASAHEVTALYRVWRPEDLERTAREALSFAADLRKRAPEARRSGIGPLEPFTAGCVAEIQNDLARVLQSRGEHAEAIGHLKLLLDDLSGGPIAEASTRESRVLLDSAKSLLLLGRHSAARAMLVSLRDRFAGTVDGAEASVLLQSGADGLDAYRGKHQGDAEHRRRMESLLSAVPAARRTLASRLGWKEEDLPRSPIGFSDALRDAPEMGANTTGDPRRPVFLPVVIVFCETISLRLLTDEELLVHELSHAALMRAFGPAYDRLPGWMREGIAEMVAGQLVENVDRLLVSRLVRDPAGFLKRQDWEKVDLAFESPPCSSDPPMAGGLSFLLLEDKHGLEGLRRLVRAISEGRTAEEALRDVTGMGMVEYLAAAQVHAASVLEARRARTASAVGEIVQALERGHSAVLEVARRALAGDIPDVARAFASWSQALALLGLGRAEEALAAYDGMIESRHRYPKLVEPALVGKASCLIVLHRTEEARTLLARIRRDARKEEHARWAAQRLAEIDAADRK
jgi:hypothetical protein